MTEAHALEHSVTGLQQDIGQFLQWLQHQSYGFHTVCPTSHAAYLKRTGKTQASNLHDIFGWSLPFKSSLIPENIFRLLLNYQLIYQQQHLWCSQIRVATLNQQYFIHSAYPTDSETAVFFGPDTYRFIHALEQHLALHQPVIKRAIEMCSGAAPAAMTLARYAPHAEVIAVDVNPLALQYAMINAAINQVTNLHAVHSNLFDGLNGQFELITANPPYLIDHSERLYRHGGNLLGAELSLNIIKQSLGYLSPDGTLLLYTGVVIANGQDLLCQALTEFMQAHKQQFSLHYQEVDPDIFADELNEPHYADAERIAAVVIKIRRLV
ncbi:methyltransferase [Alkanindiges sp. WGS2144]|uniref:methyltransferase n=1 Tax=Alkanindiges sp. WGS2144 TaxID=3366808 RepID=UPI003752FC6F